MPPSLLNYLEKKKQTIEKDILIRFYKEHFYTEK